jgi:prevent-host-death family protein
LPKEKQKPVTLTMVGLDQARKELSLMVKRAKEANMRFLVSERGRPQAVVLGIDDFLKNVLKKERASVVAEIQLESKEKGLDKMGTKEIEREIKAYRKSKA